MDFLLFYTDPGSGMMLLQVLLAFGAGILFYFRKFFYKIFGKNSAEDNSPIDEKISEPIGDGKNEGK